MVGKRDSVMGVVADESDRGGASNAALPVGSVLILRDVERDAGQLDASAIESDSTRRYPPPKHKDNKLSQAYGIGREKPAGSGPRAGVSARSIESGSASASQNTSRCAAVTKGAHGASGLRETSRAARDLRHAAGRQGEAERWLAQLAPPQLPPGIERTVNEAHSKWYRATRATTPLTVILEIEVWHGELWAHLAITGRTAPPTLAELGWCRELFLGDRKAIQVLPRKIEQAEAGARSVHLYAPLESDALPSFSIGEDR
jgi:hypothetical protein